MGELLKMLGQALELNDIRIYLDNLNHDERMEELKNLNKKSMEKLFWMADPKITLNDVIPPHDDPLKPVIFYGKNSLPVLSQFQKRMCRVADGNMIGGYNEQRLKKITGPGYFVISENTDRSGELMIDYTQIPYEKPKNWPALKSNQVGVGALVYGNLKDFLHRVSRDVFIGEATKKGKHVGYFVLCREQLG